MWWSEDGARTKPAEERHVFQGRLCGDGGVLRERAAEHQNVHFARYIVRIFGENYGYWRMIPEQHGCRQTYVWWLPTKTAGRVARASSPPLLPPSCLALSVTLNVTPVVNHMVHLKALATVHWLKPPYPTMRRVMLATTP